MSGFERGQRVRLRDERSPFGNDSLDGNGTVLRVEGGAIAVAWDQYAGGTLLIREDPRELLVVENRCSYAKQKWAAGEKYGIDGMVIFCDVHKMPGTGDDLYMGDEPEKATDRCQRFPAV